MVGLACTATIVTDRPKRGEHRAYIATWQPDRLVEYGVHLQKGFRDRAGEENLVSRVILNSLADAIGMEKALPYALYEEDRVTISTHHFGRAAQQLNQSALNYFSVTADGRIRNKNINPQAILSGSFNPLHDGHLELLQVSARLLGHPVAFEISAQNVDKPAITPNTIVQRIAQFAGRWPVYVTNAPTYLGKRHGYFLTQSSSLASILPNGYCTHATTKIAKWHCMTLWPKLPNRAVRFL